MTFGTQSRLRKEALAKMEEVMAKEHELLSLGGQAAAAAHSLGTPLSTIKIITQDLTKQFKGQKDIEKDNEKRCCSCRFLQHCWFCAGRGTRLSHASA